MGEIFPVEIRALAIAVFYACGTLAGAEDFVEIRLWGVQNLAFLRGFVPFARAKGLPERAVLLRHVLPNAAIPLVTVVGLQVGYMLGGAIVVETIFTLPGIGRMTLDAVLERNYPVVQATVILGGVMIIVVNLLVDILYAYIDPRISYGQ